MELSEPIIDRYPLLKWILPFLLGILSYYAYTLYSPTQEKNDVSSRIIHEPGNYNLESNRVYMFQFAKDDTPIYAPNASQQIMLTLPEIPVKGDIIELVDQSNRYGWGNVLYTFTLSSKYPIVGDLKDRSLFFYRGGRVLITWDSGMNEWKSQGFLQRAEDKWSGWYRLSYKGAGIALGFGQREATSVASYMRIDATQNPILITFYGGTPNYPINMVMGGEVVLWDDKSDQLTYPLYPKYLSAPMSQLSALFKMYKDGTVFDYMNGGGWIRDNRIELNEIPLDMKEIR
jgi:hypothetical protein